MTEVSILYCTTLLMTFVAYRYGRCTFAQEAACRRIFEVEGSLFRVECRERCDVCGDDIPEIATRCLRCMNEYRRTSHADFN